MTVARQLCSHQSSYKSLRNMQDPAAWSVAVSSATNVPDGSKIGPHKQDCHITGIAAAMRSHDLRPPKVRGRRKCAP